MPSPDLNRDPEVSHSIQAIIAALAKTERLAMVILPSDDLAMARSAFAQVCLAENAIDPGQRPN